MLYMRPFLSHILVSFWIFVSCGSFAWLSQAIVLRIASCDQAITGKVEVDEKVMPAEPKEVETADVSENDGNAANDETTVADEEKATNTRTVADEVRAATKVRLPADTQMDDKQKMDKALDTVRFLGKFAYRLFLFG